MNARCFHFAMVLAFVAFARPLPAIQIPTVKISSLGNAADTRTIAVPTHPNGVGTVDYEYRIATTEVTNAQYVVFLNAVAADDAYGLWDQGMTSYSLVGILRSGTPSSYA